MELSGLSSQKPSIQPKPILVDTRGNACKINVQAVELEGRPKLVRNLKNAGASVVSNIKDANIILVDTSTESGRRLIRMWGKDPSKVVLQQAWAKLSIEAGRPLLQADGWGGMMAIDDGLPVKIDGIAVDEEQEAEGLVGNPLPTPRITPVDPAAQTWDEVDVTVRLSANASGQVQTIGETVPSSSMTPSAGLHATVTSPMASQFQSPQPQLLLQAEALNERSHIPQSALSPTSFNPSSASSFSPFQAMASGAQSHETYNLFMTMLDVMRHDASGRGQPPWPSQDAPTPQAPSGVPPAIPATQAALNATSLSPNGNCAWTPLDSSQSQHLKGYTVTDKFPTTHHSKNGVAGSCNTPNSSLDKTDSRISARKPRLRSPSRQLSSEVLTPSISRKVDRPTTRPTKSRLRANKGKGKAVSPLNPDEVQSHLQSTYSASPPGPEKNIIGRRNPGEIFVAEGGQPLQFFVQVDLHRRHNVVSNIKKNKGKIVNNIPDANYVIASSRTKSYDWLLKEAAALEKTPIQAAFITDCIDECALLDESDYALEADAKLISRGRHGTSSEKKAEKRSDKPKVAKARGPETKINKFQDLSATAPEEDTESHLNRDSHTSPSNHNPASPSPPPPETRQRMASGKYYFTPEENDYLCQYAQYQFSRDTSMPTSVLAEKLNKKMPHHSIASWTSHIDQKLKGKLEGIRKRANIAKRKDTADDCQSGSLRTTYGHCQSSDAGPSKRRRMSSSSVSMSLDGELPPKLRLVGDLEKQDFDVICHFFASGGGDDDDDERVWHELARYRPCRTARSWPEFYVTHQEAVYARIEELMIERAQENP